MSWLCIHPWYEHHYFDRKPQRPGELTCCCMFRALIREALLHAVALGGVARCPKKIQKEDIVGESMRLKLSLRCFERRYGDGRRAPSLIWKKHENQMSHQQLTLSFDSWSGGILLHPFDALLVGVWVFVCVCVNAMLLTTTSRTILIPRFLGRSQDSKKQSPFDTGN